MKTKTKSLMRKLMSLVMSVAVFASLSAPASARILFQNDLEHKIEGSTLTFGTGTTFDGNDKILQFDDDADITYDVGDESFKFSKVVMFSDAVMFEQVDITTQPACDDVGEMVMDTGTNSIYVCTTAGPAGAAVWKSADNNPAQGSSADDTLRWTGTAWEASSALTNDGTDVAMTGGLDVTGLATITGGLTLDGATGNTLTLTDEEDEALSITDGTNEIMLFNTEDNPATGAGGSVTFNDNVGPYLGTGNDGALTYMSDSDRIFLGSGGLPYGMSDTVGLFLKSPTTLEMESADDTSIDMSADTTTTETLAIYASNAGSGAANIDLDADNVVSVDALSGGSINIGSDDDATVNVGLGGGAVNIAGTGHLTLLGGGTGGDFIVGSLVSGDDYASSADFNLQNSFSVATQTGDALFELGDDSNDSTFTIANGDLTYEANLDVEGDVTLGGVITAGSGDTQITDTTGNLQQTYDFSENNELTDDATVYDSLDALDLKWGDLGSTTNGEGASLIGIEDADGNFASTTVEGALADLASGAVSAGDADTLDTLDSLQFLRSDTSDNFTSGTLTFDAGTTLDVDGTFTVGASTPFSDAAGTLTLQNVDAVDATTEATIETEVFDTDAQSILGDWDNTANPWADNEVADNLTISASGSVDLGALSLTDGNIYVGDASDNPAGVTMSGDVAISNTGVTTIQLDSVTLGDDTIGNYVHSISSGNAITVTNGSTEAALASVAVTANSINEDELAASISLADGDLLDLSAIDASGTGEGLILSQANDVSLATAEGQITWDDDDDVLYVGTGTVAKAVAGTKAEVLTFYPEYSDAVFNIEGNGTLSAEDGASGPVYLWTSEHTGAAAEIAKLTKRFMLPEDFTDVDTAGLELAYEVSDTTSSVSVDLFDSSEDSCTDNVGVSGTTSGTLQINSTTIEESTCSLAAGQFVEVVIEMSVDESETAQVGELKFAYQN